MELWFENDVKMYGTQARQEVSASWMTFENDVKMYGTQAIWDCSNTRTQFENDVKCMVLKHS